MTACVLDVLNVRHWKCVLGRIDRVGCVYQRVDGWMGFT